MRKSWVKTLLAALILITIRAGLALASQPTEKPEIFQLAGKIDVDGKLEDWAGIKEWPVNQAADGARIEPSDDLTLMARFAFDAGYFYAAVEVKDESLLFPGRKNLFGDSFFLTLVEPSAAADRASFIVFGFTLRDGEPEKFVANRDGTPFPSAFTKDIQLQIVPGSNKKSFIAEAAIPWAYVPFFRPFLQPEGEINFEYQDIDPGRRKSVYLVADPNSGAGRPKRSRGLVFRFVPCLPANGPEFQSLLNASHFYLDGERKIKLAINSPSAQEGWRLTTALSSARGSQISRQELAFGRGMTVMEFPLKIEKPATGHYDLSLGIIDNQGVLKFTEDKPFFLVDNRELEALTAKIEEVKKGEKFEKDEVFRESLPTLEIRLAWIREYMAKAPALAPFDRLEQWHEEIKELVREVEAGKPALFPNGRIVRLAYRPSVDGSLQPYAAFIPEWYDSKKPLPLLLTLSGGPEGEQALSMLATAYYGPAGKKRAGDIILLAPELENPPGWDTVETGKNIMDCINHVKKIYKINEKSIVLDGTGKGAYSAFRLAFLNPNMFRGVMSQMAFFLAPPNTTIEELLELAAQAKTLNILIVQGQESLPGERGQMSLPAESDRALNAREFAAKLRQLGMNVRFLEAKPQRQRGGFREPGAWPGRFSDFGDLSVWSDIAVWLKDILGDSAVLLKPPKKQPEQEPEKK